MSKPFWKERKPKKLARTKMTTIPKHMIFFDTETYINEDSKGIVSFPLRLGVARYIRLDKHTNIIKDKTYVFTTELGFVEFVYSCCLKKQRLYIFAHNVGFDIRVLDLHELFNEINFSSKPPIINNRMFIWDVKTDKNSITFLDTANYGVGTVDQLGNDMRYPKLEIDFDTCSEDELITYCKMDVQIIMEFMITYVKFLYDNELGAFRSTIASQAFNAYRYRFMTTQPEIHVNNDALQLERDSYFGGRVECFYLGILDTDNYYHVDFNSMYPYIMLNHEVPYKFRGYTKNVSKNLLRVRVKTSYVIADVLLKTDEPAYAKKIDGKLIFPIGIFRTTLHQPDLEYAIENNHILHVYRCAVYDAKIIFDRYVNFFSDLKQQYTIDKNKSWRYITKLFLNSLYGKFAQRETVREFIGSIDEEHCFRFTISSEKTQEYSQCLMWFGELFKEYKEGETTFSCPAIAASITAYARHRLWSILKIAGRDNVYYTDTDCYFVNQQGYDNLAHLLHDNELGMLSIENQSTIIRIYGNKDYMVGDTAKHKGVTKKATKIAVDTWEYLQFQGFITWLNLGATKGMIASKRTKRRLGGYDKGEYDNQTGKITPKRLTLKTFLD